MTATVQSLVNQPYKYGFVTDIVSEQIPAGISEDVVRLISAKKNEPEFMLNFRLKAYRQWLKMDEPEWAHVHYPTINYQDIVYYSAPKKQEKNPAWMKWIQPSSKPLRSWASPSPSKSASPT